MAHLPCFWIELRLKTTWSNDLGLWTKLRKTWQTEEEALRLEVEAGEALENEAHHPKSLQQRLKDYEDEESGSHY